MTAHPDDMAEAIAWNSSTLWRLWVASTIRGAVAPAAADWASAAATAAAMSSGRAVTPHRRRRAPPPAVA